MRKMIVMLLAGIFLISGTCMASMALVAQNRMPQQGDRAAVEAELAKLANVAPEVAATTMVTVTRQDGSTVQMSVTDARAALEALLNRHICRDYRTVGTLTPGTEHGNPAQPVFTANFQKIDPNTGAAIGTPTEDTIRFRDADVRAVTAGVMGLVGQLPAGLQTKFTQAAVTKTLGRAMVLEDNKRGFMGGHQEGSTEVAESIADLPLAWLHELLEAGIISEADMLAALGENPMVDATRSLSNYVAEHGNSPEARLHGTIMAFTNKFFPKEHGELTVRIQQAMQTFAGKRPARVMLENRLTEQKQQKTKITLVVPAGTSKVDSNTWDSVKAISDVAEVKVVQAGNAQDIVNACKAVPEGEIVLVVATDAIAGQIAGLSDDDKKVLAKTALLQVEKPESFDKKLGGKPMRDTVLGILLQLHTASQTKDVAERDHIIQGLIVELSQISGRAEEVTAEHVLQLLPIADNIQAFNERLRVLAAIQLLPAATPTNWRYQDILAVRSVIIAA